MHVLLYALSITWPKRIVRHKICVGQLQDVSGHHQTNLGSAIGQSGK